MIAKVYPRGEAPLSACSPPPEYAPEEFLLPQKGVSNICFNNILICLKKIYYHLKNTGKKLIMVGTLTLYLKRLGAKKEEKK